MNITKIDKQNKLNSISMAENKVDMNITKIEKYKKLNNAGHKIDRNITKTNKYITKKTKKLN